MKYVLLLMFLCSPLMADDKTKTVTEGYVGDKYITTTKKASSSKGQTTTRGYISSSRGSKYVDLKTRETSNGTTVTTGYIDGEYVEIREKKKDG